MKQVHIRLPDEITDMIEETMEGKSINEKVTRFVCSTYITNELLNLQKKKLKAEIEFIDNYLKNNPFHTLNVLSGKEQEFLNETIKLMESSPDRWKKNPRFLRARSHMFNNDFSRNITFREFELLVYRFKENKVN